MGTLTDFGRDFRRLKSELKTLPGKISDGMVEQTRRNFAAEAYTNDGIAEVWKKRYYDVHKTPIGTYYTHKKLNYNGRLLRSIKPIHAEATAGVQTNVPYAKVHNEGGTPPGIRWVQPRYKINRKRPENIPARKFMGFGAKDEENIQKNLENIVDKHFG